MDPHDLDAQYKQANALLQRGEVEEAIASYEKVIAVQPGHAAALNNLGCAWLRVGRVEKAIEFFQRAITARPDYAQAFSNLGDAWLKMGEAAKAEANCRRALEIEPNRVDAHSNLGNALREVGRIDEAVQEYRQALAYDSRNPDLLNNLGNALIALREYERAEECFRHALSAQPENGPAHWYLALLRLLTGDYERGFELYEWRRKVPGLGAGAALTQPLWDGSPLNGRRILIHFEQAFGDVIQCARYVPKVAERGGQVVLAVPMELYRLMLSLPSVEKVIKLSDPLPSFDVHCPIMSLPFVFRTRLDTIPANVPYLSCDQALKQKWGACVPKDDRVKVGVAWSGRRRPDPLRAVPPGELLPLTNVQGCWFCSVQKSLVGSATELPLADFSHNLHDFAETAALIGNLDVIITIDTGVAHLAGAMGKPVWLLLKDVPDWRWLLDRADSPWYPTMKLFRQSVRGSWKEPIDQIVAELRALVDRQSRG
jgi:Tfp pilus assembly protein PilF